MKYTNDQIELLRAEVGKRLSDKRYNHTLGVEEMAVIIGKSCLPSRIDELRVAALLHDISKEYSEAEQLLVVKKHNIPLSEEDYSSPELWHSFTAPGVITDEFPDYVDDDILSSVEKHTVGSPEMSVFDEIILLADYIEKGRRYENCINLRNKFLNELERAVNDKEAILALHKAVVESLDNNIREFVSRGKNFHTRTVATRDAILAKIERYKMDIFDLKNVDSGILAREAVKILIEKKAIDVKLFDVKEKSSITDYYINVTGRSITQVSSLADDIDAKLAERGRPANRIEGKRGNSWILVDFGDLIVNVFDRASREFYNLDRHFPEDSLVDISDLVAEVDKKFEINNSEE